MADDPQNPPAPTPALTREEVADLVSAELSRKANGAAVPAAVVDAMVDAKLKAADARRELAQVQAALANAVPEGARVLAPDEAAAYDAFLGDAGSIDAAVQARVAQSEPAKALAKIQRGQALATFQTEDGQALNLAAFDRLDGFKDLRIDTEGEGEAARPVAVMADGSRVPLADHIAAQDDATRALLLSAPAAPKNPAVPVSGPASTPGAAPQTGLLASYQQKRQAARQPAAA